MYKQIVVPFVKKIISQSNYDISLKIEDVKQLKELDVFLASAEESSKIKNILVFLENESQLDDCKIEQHLPLIVFLSKMTKTCNQKIPFKLFLDASETGNFDACKKMATLGNSCGMFIKKDTDIKWHLLEDLFEFSIKCNLPIEPFEYILHSRDRKNKLPQLQYLYFNEPQSFLHFDCNGNYAFSIDDLEQDVYAGNITSDDWDAINRKWTGKQIEEYSCFLDGHHCVSCESWRICKGIYYVGPRCNCRPLFLSIISQKNKEVDNKRKKYHNERTR
jgi:hypothetical protein